MSIKSSHLWGWWLRAHNLDRTMVQPAPKKRKLSPVDEAGRDGVSSDDAASEESLSDGNLLRSSRKVPKISNTTANHRPALAHGASTSSILQTQIDHLLAKVRPDYERRLTRAENAVHKLRRIIEDIPSRDAKPVRTIQSISPGLPNPCFAYRFWKQSVSNNKNTVSAYHSQNHILKRTQNTPWRSRNQPTSMLWVVMLVEQQYKLETTAWKLIWPSLCQYRYFSARIT